MNPASSPIKTALLVLALLLGACGGSAIPVELPDGYEFPPLDVAQDAMDRDADPDAAPDVAMPCSCLPDAPCTTTAPECQPVWCQGVEDCDDGNPCTEDLCNTQTHECEHFTLPSCCLVAADCDDEIDCTDDTCVDNGCVHTPAPDCCFENEDCDDGFDPTTDLCLDHVCYAVFDEPVSCEQDDECIAGDRNGCYAATCRSGICAYAPATNDNCCTLDTDCTDSDPCTEDLCREFHCVYVLSNEPQAQIDEDFDDRQISGLVPAGAIGELAWRFTSDRSSSEPYALRYGYPTGGYGGSVAFEAVVQTAWLQLPDSGPATLTFSSYVDIADSGDEIVVEAVGLSGATVLLWTPTTFGTWSEEEIDLADYAGSQIRLRFLFVSDGSTDLSHEGWYLDDVRTIFRCLPPT